MKNTIKIALLGLSCIYTTSSIAFCQNCTTTGIYQGSITVKNNDNDGSGDYYAHEVISGATLAECTTNLNAAKASTVWWSWSACQLKSIHSAYKDGVYTVAAGGDGSNVIDQISSDVADLSIQYDLNGYQDELDELDARYRINEYKDAMVEIYQQATRRPNEEQE